jgi:hypothetical protein
MSGTPPDGSKGLIYTLRYGIVRGIRDVGARQPRHR